MLQRIKVFDTAGNIKEMVDKWQTIVVSCGL
jgi:hypothetical protein